MVLGLLHLGGVQAQAYLSLGIGEHVWMNDGNTMIKTPDYTFYSYRILGSFNYRLKESPGNRKTHWTDFVFPIVQLKFDAESIFKISHCNIGAQARLGFPETVINSAGIQIAYPNYDPNPFKTRDTYRWAARGSYAPWMLGLSGLLKLSASDIKFKNFPKVLIGVKISRSLPGYEHNTWVNTFGPEQLSPDQGASTKKVIIFNEWSNVVSRTGLFVSCGIEQQFVLKNKRQIGLSAIYYQGLIPIVIVRNLVQVDNQQTFYNTRSSGSSLQIILSYRIHQFKKKSKDSRTDTD